MSKSYEKRELSVFISSIMNRSSGTSQPPERCLRKMIVPQSETALRLHRTEELTVRLEPHHCNSKDVPTIETLNTCRLTGK